MKRKGSNLSLPFCFHFLELKKKKVGEGMGVATERREEKKTLTLYASQPANTEC